MRLINKRYRHQFISNDARLKIQTVSRYSEDVSFDKSFDF